ncbi:MAG: MnhB domain-containing protein [Thermomicrobiales bacterium]
MSVMTQAIARLLLPASLMVAAGVLVKGYADTGDGFSAAIIASLGVLMQYVAFGRSVAAKLMMVRQASTLAFIGLLIALAVAVTPLFLGDPVMTHYPRAGSHASHIGSLELITPVLFDVGVFLLVLGFAIGAIDLIAQTVERGRTWS